MINKIEVCNNLELDEKKTYNIYQYGSTIYGTDSEFSDIDFIIIRRQIDYRLEDHGSFLDIQGTYYNKQGFEIALKNHEISILECLNVAPEFRYEEFKFNYSIDLHKLRESISAKVSNSWVKAKKKFFDGEIYTAQKSLFHCFRMIYFGKQLALTGKINDFHGYNFDPDYKSFKEFFWIIQSYTSWTQQKEVFQQKLNIHLHEFKILAPKL